MSQHLDGDQIAELLGVLERLRSAASTDGGLTASTSMLYRIEGAAIAVRAVLGLSLGDGPPEDSQLMTLLDS